MSTKTTVQPAPHRWVARPEWQSPYGVPVHAVDRNERDECEHIGNIYREEDARLVAAAPELLEALRAAVVELAVLGRDLEEIDNGIRSYPTALLNDDTMAQVRAAIAKAEGR